MKASKEVANRRDRELLVEARENLDEIDEQILALLERRAALAMGAINARGRMEIRSSDEDLSDVNANNRDRYREESIIRTLRLSHRQRAISWRYLAEVWLSLFSAAEQDMVPPDPRLLLVSKYRIDTPEKIESLIGAFGLHDVEAARIERRALHDVYTGEHHRYRPGIFSASAMKAAATVLAEAGVLADRRVVFLGEDVGEAFGVSPDHFRVSLRKTGHKITLGANGPVEVTKSPPAWTLPREEDRNELAPQEYIVVPGLGHPWWNSRDLFEPVLSFRRSLIRRGDTGYDWQFTGSEEDGS